MSVATIEMKGLEASAADTREIAVDPLAIGDSSESSRGGIPDLEDTIYDIVHYMSEVRIDRITKIETTQRQLEASQLVASGERASLVERIGSLRLEYLKVRAMLSIERDRIDSLRWHMALSQEEFRQVRRDRDDTRRRLRRLESTMTITRSGMTPEAIEELINRCVEEALAAHEATHAANALEAENLFGILSPFLIMPPRMRTRSAGRPAAESLGGGTGVRVGRGGRGRRPREEGANGGAPDFSTIITQQLQNLLPAMLAQVSNRGNDGNQNGNVVNENVQENIRNVIVNDNQVRPVKRGELSNRTLSRVVTVSMSWDDFKFMMIQEFCPSHEMQKLESELWNHAMVGAGHAVYTDRFYELAIFGALTDEAVRNGSIKNIEKRGNVGKPSKDRSGRDDNKRTRTVNAFATTVNPVGRENTGTYWPKGTTFNSYHAPGGPCRTCFNCNRSGHLARDCRGVPRNVNPINARNPTVRACYECGGTDHVMSACPRLNRARGLEENCPNLVAANNEG
ncbi:putative reverse transcriptase domain-containing protein [Tanacetum coccineum]